MTGLGILTRDLPLKHGYTLAIIQELTSVAVHNERFYTYRDHAERMDIAWSAIVEYLYASEESPTRHDLLREGMNAIGSFFKSERRHHGIPQDRRSDFGVNYERYWETFSRPTPSPEEWIVERIALVQVWKALTQTARATFTTLAAWDDYELAAQAVDRTPSQFNSQMSYSRKMFLELWHDGESPSRPWGHDRRRTKKEVNPRYTAKIIRQRRRRAEKRDEYRASRKKRGALWVLPVRRR